MRVNKRKTTVEGYLADLEAAGHPATAIGPYAIRLDNPLPVYRIPGFSEGLVSVQDAAAQLAAPLLELQDACGYWMPVPPRAANPAICSRWLISICMRSIASRKD